MGPVDSLIGKDSPKERALPACYLRIRLLPKDLLARKVIAWYRNEGRRLPWRMTKSPYRIWVSEVMLQQTRVTFAIPYYQRFLDAFPTVRRLAEADLEEVLKQWEGMGYYARARNLHRSAKMVRERYEGSIPDNMEELLSLPGIGRSTAGAILSLAYGRKIPILDANIQRLLCRLSAVQEDPQKSHAKRLLWDLMERLLPEKDTRLFNQGLMDIGALFCLPRSPRCRNCPLSSLCLAFARGIQDRIPPLKKARPLPLRERAVAIIWRKGDLLIHHRPSSGLLGGLWEFPGAYVDRAGSAFRLLSRMFEQECGLLIQVKEEIFSFLHEYTHFKEIIRVFSGDYQQGKDSLAEGFRWVRLEEIEQLPLSASHRRIAQEVSRLGGGQRTRTQMLPFQGGG